jgi:hypothetical protein
MPICNPVSCVKRTCTITRPLRFLTRFNVLYSNPFVITDMHPHSSPSLPPSYHCYPDPSPNPILIPIPIPIPDPNPNPNPNPNPCPKPNTDPKPNPNPNPDPNPNPNPTLVHLSRFAGRDYVCFFEATVLRVRVRVRVRVRCGTFSPSHHTSP